jgi:hypothetical protein
MSADKEWYDQLAVHLSHLRRDGLIEEWHLFMTNDFSATARIRQIGTRNLVDAARAAGVGHIIAQSIAAWVYSPGEGPADENVPLDSEAPSPNVVDDEPAKGTAWLPVYAATLGAPVPPTSAGPTRATRGASNSKARHILHCSPTYPSWREGFAQVAQQRGNQAHTS